MNLDPLNLVWLTGSSCDGCTIKALGETTAGGLEALLTGRAPGLPRIRLLHPLLSVETGEAFMERLEEAARGELEPYGVVNESALPAKEGAAHGFYSSLGESEGRPVPVSRWLDRLAPGAAFVLAWGDCGVWGGPHSLSPNPTGATGTSMHLGHGYRSTWGLPVVNLPGCAAPPVLIATMAAILRWAQGTGPPLELDETSRPSSVYGEVWDGALTTWSE